MFDIFCRRSRYCYRKNQFSCILDNNSFLINSFWDYNQLWRNYTNRVFIYKSYYKHSKFVNYVILLISLILLDMQKQLTICIFYSAKYSNQNLRTLTKSSSHGIILTILTELLISRKETSSLTKKATCRTIMPTRLNYAVDFKFH